MSASGEISSPRHGGQLREIATRYSISAEDLIDFSVNINPDGPPPSVRTAILRGVEDSSTFTSYPDLELTELKKVLAECNDVEPKNIAIANGFVPLLEAALHFLKVKRCLLPVPCFAEYRRTLEHCGCETVALPLFTEESFQYDPKVILRELLNSSCDALLIANPQNPSGALYRASQMRQLVEVASQNDISVLLDEAFIDYCPAHSLISDAACSTNIIVFRSVTKYFALPGLRVAYSVANVASTQGMSSRIAPWPVTTLASHGVCAALQDDVYARESRRTNERRRAWLERELSKLGIFVCPSNTNFLLLRFPAAIDVSSLWARMMVEQQIVLRLCTNFEGLASGYLRVAVRSDNDNERLIRGLRDVLASMRS